MRRLSSFAWRSLRARPLRSFLTAAGVALGVGVMFASLSAGAAMDAAVDRAASDDMGRAAVRVEALEEKGLGPQTLAIVRSVRGAAVVAPALERRTYLAASLATRPGAPLPAPVTVLGVDPNTEPLLHDMPLSGGRPLTAVDTRVALVSQTLASQEGLRLGDTIGLDGAARPGPQDYTIVGILAGDGYLPRAEGRLVVLPVAAAQALFDVGGVTRIDLGLRAGVTADQLIDDLERSIDTEPYLLAQTSDTAAALRAETADLRAILLLVAAVVLFTGAFLIFNTLSMTVTERTRDVGLLRAAGTTPRQVMGLMLLQALALGLAGSVAGVAGGTALASLTLSWVGSTGSVEFGGPVLAPGPVILALSIGVLVTLAAALEPSWRAGRIPPVEALRRGPPGEAAGSARLRWLVLVFAVLAFAALAVWPDGSASSSPVSSGVRLGSAMWGPLLVFGLLLAAVLILPRALGPLLRLAGVPFRLFRSQERLARSSLARDPGRTALTAGAMVVGLAMVVALGTATQNVRQIGQSWLSQTVPGSELLSAIHPLDATSEVPGDIAGIPGVKSVSPIGLFSVPLLSGSPAEGVRREAAAIVGVDYARDGRLNFVAGDRDNALLALDAGGAAIVPQSLASQLGLRVGDTLSFGTGATPTRLTVAGIVAHSIPGDSAETILVGWGDALGAFGVTGADFLAVRYEPGREAAARPAVDAMARQYALQPSDLNRVRGTVGDALERVFRLLDALALIAVLVAGLGMANTLSMSVMQRVREIGVLRASGMSGRQVWSMVVVEAGVLAVASTLTGAVVGLVVGGLLVSWSTGTVGPAFDPPWASIGLAVLFGVLVGITASIYPAGVASRRSIVEALQNE